MTASLQDNYLGRLVPAPNDPPHQDTLGSYLSEVVVYVSSTNEDEKRAALEAVSQRLTEIYGDTFDVEVIGKKVSSDIAEQPIDEAGRLGAENRLLNLKKMVASEISEITSKMIYYVSLENGMVREKIESHNPEVFENKDGTTWVDRCFVVVENASLGKKSYSQSVGVTTPRDCMEEAEKRTPADYDRRGTGYAVTAGMIVEERYDFPSASSWHEGWAGKSRFDLMRDAIIATQFV